MAIVIGNFIVLVDELLDEAAAAVFDSKEACGPVPDTLEVTLLIVLSLGSKNDDTTEARAADLSSGRVELSGGVSFTEAVLEFPSLIVFNKGTQPQSVLLKLIHALKYVNGGQPFE